MLPRLAQEWADRDDLGALTVTEIQQRWRVPSEDAHARVARDPAPTRQDLPVTRADKPRGRHHAV